MTMNPTAIPEELVPIVLEKASRLYQQQSSLPDDTFSLDELIAAGKDVQIPPALIQQAYQQLQQEQREAAQRKAQQQRIQIVGSALSAVLALSLSLWFVSTYNALNAAKTEVDSKWAQVENQMQRRADLIPQLTQVAEGYMGREAAAIQKLSAARTTFLAAGTVAERSAADEEMKQAIAQFQTFAASSQPLQSSQLFVNLQYEIAGSENRIATERMRYNQAVASYNRSIAGFPTVLAARMLGFEAQTFLGRR
ncbi:MAG: LemA family protein [Phormidesmis sp.]